MPRSWAERFIWFTIAVLLCWFAADYFSRSLHHFYHDWSGWRSITGSSPNFVTKKLLPLSQIIFFLLFIFCLWQLDKLVITKNNRPAHDKSPHDEKHSREQRDSRVNSDDQSPQQIENKATEQNSAADRESTTSSNPEPILFAEDIKHAQVLGLTQDETKDFSKIKSTYRRVIAQYHPDKVGDMGPEIKEIAEAKAKEINHAYQHFRKKFQRDEKPSPQS